jgi:hypothetical protein
MSSFTPFLSSFGTDFLLFTNVLVRNAQDAGVLGVIVGDNKASSPAYIQYVLSSLVFVFIPLTLPRLVHVCIEWPHLLMILQMILMCPLCSWRVLTLRI